MRIVHLTPGSGEFYCENCLRDSAVVRAMRQAGHHAVMAPLYLPIRADRPVESPLGPELVADGPAPLFFGGVNAYLQQKSAMFRHTPRWVDRLFDWRPLLRWLSRNARMTRPRGLGEMTLSMLRGEHGRQAKELRRLTRWLASDSRPEVVCLSNALLLGLARGIAELGVPVVCLLRDEDFWLDGLPEPFGSRCWEAMRRRSADVSLFVAPSRYYAQHMGSRLGIDPARLAVVPDGIDPRPYAPPEVAPRGVIGYLSRMCPQKGLGTLAEAFVELRRRKGTSGVRLRVAGGLTPDDRPYVETVADRLRSAGLLGEVEFVEDISVAGKAAFLRSLSVLSVPTARGEAMGLYMLEAWACGVPVVQPRHGSFPELIEPTGGGSLFEPNDSRSLADALEAMLLDDDARDRAGLAGRRAVLERFTAERSAAELVRQYGQLTGPAGTERGANERARD